MSLADWRRNGWLLEHETSAQEIRELLAVAERDLSDSGVTGLSPDTQLGLAYNAALQVAAAALAASGYRASRELKHYRTVQSLSLTIGLDAETVNKLDAFRRKRNISDYERAGFTSEREAREMREFARDLRARVEAWLCQVHPELVR